MLAIFPGKWPFPPGQCHFPGLKKMPGVHLLHGSAVNILDWNKNEYQPQAGAPAKSRLLYFL